MTGHRGVVTSRQELEHQDGCRVKALGTYRAIAPPRKGPPDPDAPHDHATLILGDGTIVYLEPLYEDKARRPPEERARFDGRRVTVAGIARKVMPSVGAGLIAPCLTDIERIEIRP